jgi:hypothetical protein
MIFSDINGEQGIFILSQKAGKDTETDGPTPWNIY